MLLMTCGIVIVAQKLGKIDYQKIDPKRLSISEEVEHQTGVVTFALFGLDSRTGQLDRGTLSDTMIIAVLDRETKEITMSSVYRDTLVQMEDGSYNKANAAYAFGGPQEAISMLNRNFDLNIEDYVSVNFNALVNVIDALGGVDLDVTEEEVPHLNNYQVETSKVVGQERIPLEHGGMQTLNGVQAVSFARIRIIGGDQQRTERQRRLIQATQIRLRRQVFLRSIRLLTRYFRRFPQAYRLEKFWIMPKMRLSISWERVRASRMISSTIHFPVSEV